MSLDSRKIIVNIFKQLGRAKYDLLSDLEKVQYVQQNLVKNGVLLPNNSSNLTDIKHFQGLLNQLSDSLKMLSDNNDAALRSTKMERLINNLNKITFEHGQLSHLLPQLKSRVKSLESYSTKSLKKIERSHVTPREKTVKAKTGRASNVGASKKRRKPKKGKRAKK